MSQSIKLTPKQIKYIDELWHKEAECFCGVKLLSMDRRALLAQPHSTRTDTPGYEGTLRFKQMCDGCFQILTEAFNKCYRRNKHDPD